MFRFGSALLTNFSNHLLPCPDHGLSRKVTDKSQVRLKGKESLSSVVAVPCENPAVCGGPGGFPENVICLSVQSEKECRVVTCILSQIPGKIHASGRNEKSTEIWAELWAKYGKVAEKEPKGCTGPERGTVLTGLKPRVKLRSSDSREKALPGDRAANPDLR